MSRIAQPLRLGQGFPHYGGCDLEGGAVSAAERALTALVARDNLHIADQMLANGEAVEALEEKPILARAVQEFLEDDQRLARLFPPADGASAANPSAMG